MCELEQYKPVLSAQFITAPTGSPTEMRNFPPAVPPRPGWEKNQDGKYKNIYFKFTSTEESLDFYFDNSPFLIHLVEYSSTEVHTMVGTVIIIKWHLAV